MLIGCIIAFIERYITSDIFMWYEKLGLVQKDKRERRVDYHTTTDYADGHKLCTHSDWRCNAYKECIHCTVYPCPLLV